jgi:hypothetical protein
VYDKRDIASELRDGGSGLWSSVECDVKRDRIVVYARLVSHARSDLENALAESERVLKTVLGQRVAGGNGWLAAVQWSERLCKTFTEDGRDGPAAQRSCA